MDQYVTGAVIRRLREEKRLSQTQLAESLNVSEISKWETEKGYPDIALIAPLLKLLVFPQWNCCPAAM